MSADAEAAEALRLFAERHRREQEAARLAKRAAKQARTVAARSEGLVRTKDEAAARLKALRRDGRDAQAVAAADRTYREALAAVLADEAGDPGAGG